ncbi:Lipoprotein-anchoring transpeptidase ErfK/SrfK [Klenkia marina]|uniref:Lipoprotein-anchoring transpeptidase ErfK/SrfK n=1 Tax=Klenkia marina TaxID=1960309 RepID=A0A1G4Y7Z3_9ACTN|nr:Ig-like domain-containing protein [Klenkia marina]SCX49617.1 Lipoprotein-anchoring transpeptidase ErfK/SrfK [Klenkia marina]
MSVTRARRLPLAVLPLVLAVVVVTGLAGCRSGLDADADTPAPSTTAAAPTTAAVPAAVISVDPPLGSVDVDPVTPLRVLAGHGTLTSVAVTDADGVPLAGALDAAAGTWTASEDLGYGDTYAVAVTATGADGRATSAQGTVGTVSPRTLTMPTVFPNADAPVVGVGQPISVTFDEDVADRAAVERRLSVVTSPHVDGSWSWLSDRTVHYRPADFWPAHTHVAVDVDTYGVDVGAGIHGQASKHVEFDIGPKKVGVVDAGELTLRLYVDDQLVQTMPTSLGKPGSPTPSGTYVVMQQSRRYTMDSSTYGVPIDDPAGYRTEVEYASRLSNSGIFVHAAPWSVGQQGRRNVSHGCLNVSTANAGWFYSNFGRGDVVQVTGAGPLLSETDGYGDWNVGWEQWVAGSALAPAVG